MTLTAFSPDLNKKVIAYKHNLVNPKDHDWLCPSCQEGMLFVDATKKIKHFRHKHSADCEYMNESEAHLRAKTWCYERLGNPNNADLIDIEHRIPSGRILDIYLKRGEEQFGAEIQYSSIATDEWVNRMRDYTKDDVGVVWIVPEPRTTEEYDHTIDAVGFGCRFKNIHKLTHWTNFGRVYWLNNTTLYATHIKYRTKTLSKWFIEVESKTKRLVRVKVCLPHGDFFNMPDTNEEILSARFMDKRFW